MKCCYCGKSIKRYLIETDFHCYYCNKYLPINYLVNQYSKENKIYTLATLCLTAFVILSGIIFGVVFASVIPS